MAGVTISPAGRLANRISSTRYGSMGKGLNVDTRAVHQRTGAATGQFSPIKGLNAPVHIAAPTTTHISPAPHAHAPSSAPAHTDPLAAAYNYDPSVPLSGDALKAVVDAMTKASTKPALDQIGRTEHDTLNRSTYLTDLTKGYAQFLANQGKTIQAGADKSNAQSTQAFKDIAGQGQNSRDAVNSLLYKQIGADQQVRGGLDGGANSALATNALQQDNTARTAANSFQGQGATNNQASSQMLAGMLATGQLRSNETQGQIAGQTAATLRDLQGKKADVMTKAAGDQAKLITDLKQQGFNNVLATQGLGLKAQDIANAYALGTQRNNIALGNLKVNQGSLQERAAHNAVLEQLSKRGLDLKSLGIRLAHADRVASIAARSSKGLRGLSPKQLLDLQQSNDGVRGAISAATALIPQLEGQQADTVTYKNVSYKVKEAGKVVTRTKQVAVHTPGKQFSSSAQIRAFLEDKFGKGGLGKYSHTIVNAAYDLAKHGSLSNQNIRALRGMYVGVPKQWLAGPGIRGPAGHPG